MATGNTMYLDFRNGFATVLTAGSSRTPVAGLSSTVATGIVIRASAVAARSGDPFGETAGSGKLKVVSDEGSIHLKSPASSATISIQATKQLEKDIRGDATEYFYGPSYKGVYGLQIGMVLFSDLGVSLAGNSSIEFSRWRFRVSDAKWAVSVMKLIGMKVGFDGIKDDKAAATTVLKQMVNGMGLAAVKSAAAKMRQHAVDLSTDISDVRSDVADLGNGTSSLVLSPADLYW